MTTSNNHQYTTSDTALATYLICQGFILEQIDYSKLRYEYKFGNDSTSIQRHAQLYLTGKALVDPATFTRVNRKLTRIIKQQLQWGEE